MTVEQHLDHLQKQFQQESKKDDLRHGDIRIIKLFTENIGSGGDR